MTTSRGSEFSVALAATSGQMLGSNPKRTGFWISSPASGRFTISSSTPAVLDGPGLTINAGQVPVFIGGWGMEWVKRSLQVIHSAGGISVGGVEVEGET